MASVIRDSYQKRDPEIRRLPTPPAKVIRPVAKPPTTVKEPVPVMPKAPEPRATVFTAAQEVEQEIAQETAQKTARKPTQKTPKDAEGGYDLLALMGWKT